MKAFSFSLAALALVSGPLVVFGQTHRPLTDQVPAASEQVVSPAAHTASSGAPNSTESRPTVSLAPQHDRSAIGPATVSLLEAQVAGTNAGRTIPTLGATASRSWKRYLDSFSNPLPPMFENSVDSD